MSDKPPGGPSAREVFAYFRHELRTPVNAILGYSEMLLEDAAPAEQEPLERLRRLGQELLASINELLAPARSEGPEETAARVVREEVGPALRPLASEVVAICDRLLGAYGAESPVASDLDRIRTAGRSLLALLDAARSLPEKRPALDLFRADPGEPDAATAETTPLAAGNILVVDDDPFNRDLLARGLHRQGHHFALAGDGPKALEMVKTQAFDVVLLDVMMPGMSGIEVLARLKNDPAQRDLPVIMVSALDELDGVVRCIEMGAVDFLPKPFNPVLLKARLETTLEKKRLRDRELAYLRDVGTVTASAAALEAGTFAPEPLADVMRRDDALGVLARVFERMAREVRAREEKLRQEVVQLRVEIDEAKKTRQVDEITRTDYFQQLRRKAQALRERRDQRETPA